MIDPKSIKKILVINLGGIGDVLISTPALRALKQHFTDSQIYVLVVPRAREVVMSLPYVDKIFSFYPEGLWSVFIINLDNIIRLRREKIDLAINMRTMGSRLSAWKIKFLLRLINPRIKAGRDTSGRGYFLDIKVPEEDIGNKYEMEYDLETVRALGVATEDKKIDLVIDPASKEIAEQLLKDNGIRESDILIGIHPGGKPSHRWPVENFAEVMRKIQQETGAKIFVTGSPDEKKLVEDLIRQSNLKALDLCGKLNIKSLAAILAKTKLYITNDTGVMHVAAIMKTPLVAIFGPGYFHRYDPANISGKTISLYKKAPCAPCDRSSCDNLSCLKQITPAEVIESAVSLLGQNK
jgi:heptosyltransferase II